MALIDLGQTRAGEIRDMLDASFTLLNSEYGFSLAVTKEPDLERFIRDLTSERCGCLRSSGGC